MDNRKILSVIILCLLSVFGIAGIVFAGNGDSSGSGDAMFCEAPSISVKDQLGQPVENAVIAVTYTNGSDSKSMDLTTPVSGAVTLGAKSGTYTFELKSVPAAYTMGSTTKIVQDCQDGKSMAGKTFTVSNNAVQSTSTSSTSGDTYVSDFSFGDIGFNFTQNLALSIIENNPEMTAYFEMIIHNVIVEMQADGTLNGDSSDPSPSPTVSPAPSPTPTPSPTTTVKPTPTPED